MKTHFFTENSLVFVVVCSLVCFGSTQKDETDGVSSTYVTKGEDVVLNCSLRTSKTPNLEVTVVDWKNTNGKEVFHYSYDEHDKNGRPGQDDQYKGRVSLFYDELKNGNASMILRNTRVEDTGIYTCELPHLSSGRKIFTMELIVGVSRTYVCKGEDAVLHCSSGGNLENTVVDWKNKDKEVFLYSYGEHYENGRLGQDNQYKGRVSLFYKELKNGNASMILRNTSVEDTGIYTCVLPHLSPRSQIWMELIIGVSRTYVTEGEDAVLHCSSGESLENKVIFWKNTNGKDLFLYERGHHTEDGWCCQDDQYKGRVSLFYDELKNRNASMILRNTRIEDTGIYTCELPLLSSGRKTFTMELIVEPVYKNRFGLEKGAVHAPYVGISDMTEDGVELQCEVKGSSSKPSVEWETCKGISLNATNQTVSETRGRYDTTSFITVTEMKTNCFSCVVKQEDIYHRVHSEIILPEKLFEIKSSHSSGELVGIWFSGVVTVLSLLLLALVLYQIIRRCRWKMNLMMKSKEKKEHMSTNKTSGETNDDVKLKIPQTDSDCDETSSLQSNNDSASSTGRASNPLINSNSNDPGDQKKRPSLFQRKDNPKPTDMK